jgi:ABC-type phosphate transport system substrate-binding protein
MTMFPKSVALGLALLSSLAIAPISVMTDLRQDATMAVAQTSGDPTVFPLPEAVPSGTTVRIDGSSSMTVLNETLKQRFEDAYSGTDVELASQGTDVALQALQEGDIDLAAVGRPLTDAEKAQGFVEVLVSREKIAIIVGATNSFDENLTFDQFAQMFRGEITDWSGVGGDPGPIRFIDRDESSDTRLSLSRYDVFQSAPFRVGDNAITVDDDTSAVIEALGSTGISYAIASQVLGREDVKIISMHQTLPDDPAYPYSQPRGYVYYEEPSAAAAAFLGYATADEGQAAIQEAKEVEAIAVNPGESSTPVNVLEVPPIGGILYSTSLAYSPDGQLIAAASNNGQVRLFDAEGNAVGEPLSGLTGQLSSLAFSPDGTRLVGASDDGSIQFWQTDGTPIGNPLTGHDSAITSVVFSPDGESIATAGADGTIWRWDLEGTQIGAPFTGHEGAINGLAFRPDARAIASAGADGTIRLWDVDGTLLSAPLTGHQGAVNSVAFDERGEVLASAGGDGTVRLWDAEGNALGAPFEGHEGAVSSVAFIPGSSELVSAGTDGTLRFWNRDGQSTGVASADTSGAIAALALSPDGSSMVTGGTDGTLQSRNRQGEPVGDPIDGYISSITPARGKLPAWIWWLLPLAVLAVVLWWLSRRSSDASQDEPSRSATRPTGASADGRTGDDGQPAMSSHLTAAFAAAEAGQSEMALEHLDKAVQDEPTQTLAWTARGNLLNQMDRPEEALESFNTALNIQADLPQALVGKGTALTKLGQADDAVPIFDRAITAANKLPAFNMGNLATGGLLIGGTALTAKALSGKGFALLDTQNAGAQTAQEALDAFDEALVNDPKSVAAIAGRNRALERLNRSSPSSDASSPSPSRQRPGYTGGMGAGTVSAVGGDRDQSTVESKKFDVGQTDVSAEALADVDRDLPDLPDGYGESRIMLLPRDPQWAFAYWDIANEHKDDLRQQGGQTLALRLYDVTDIDLDHQNPHSLQQYACDEMARDWYMPIPVSDRDYLVEIGYVTASGGWLLLARSAPVHIPPIYPSDWSSDQFLTVDWGEDLQGKTFTTLVPPTQAAADEPPIHDQMFIMSQSTEALRVAGSLFGSMQQVPPSAISSYGFPSGIGMMTAAGASGAGMIMSGIGMSGVGFSASAPPIRPRKFWLVADAELIVYGATEPDATVTIGGTPIQLDPDGTFRFQMSFQDGEIDFPIRAIAADGEQVRSIRMDFERDTPARNTNTKDEAVDEWFGE